MTGGAFVERTFSRSGQTIICRFSQPVSDGQDFRCGYSLEGAGVSISSGAWGVDSVQALLLAMQKAHLDLLSSNTGERDRISWHGSDDLGLPLPKA
jgi:hypothetical protein